MGASRFSGLSVSALGAFCREALQVGARLGRVIALLWSTSPLLTMLVAGTRIAESLLLVGLLYAGTRILDALSGGAVPPSDILFLLVLTGSAIAAAQVAELAQTLLSERLTHSIRERILTKAASLDYVHFESASFYDALSRAQQEAGFRPVQILQALVESGKALVTVVGLLALVGRISPWLGLVLAAASVPFFISQTRHAYLAYRLAQWTTPETREMGYIGFILTDRQPAKEVRLFGFAPYLLGRQDAIFRSHHARTRALALARAGWGLATGLVMVGAFVGGAAYLARQVETGALSIGDAVVVIGALLVGQGQVRALIAGVSSLYENNLFLTDLFAFLALAPPTAPPVGSAPASDAAGIRFERVSFTYPGVSTPAVRDVDLELRPGEIVALVGANGAGKTTLVKLLCGLYEPAAGRVLLDGRDLRCLDRAEIWTHVAVNFQDYARYSFTARETIGLGKVAAIDDADCIRRAAEDAGAAGMVERLPRSYDTRLGRMFEDGVDLSDGQWQRLALARAFMKDAPLLVLDEPTASADALAEYQFFERVRDRVRRRRDHGVLLISHRFGNVRLADRIYVMEDGSIVEQGTHEDLMARRARYAELFTVQAAGYR